MADVFDFGAAGDGQRDDTAALQHALTAGDGVLQLRKGTYRITRPLVLDLTRTGHGAVLGLGGTSRIVMAGAGPALEVVGDHRGTALPSSVQPHTWEKERFPVITDVEILGDHPEAIGIQLRRTMQATVSRVLVRHCRYAVHLVERNRNFVLSDSHLYDNAEYGLFLDRCNLHQINVTGNHISYNKRAGIKSLDGDVHNLQITGNDIEYNNHPGGDASPRGEPRGAEVWFECPEGTISEVTIASNTLQATVQPGGANVRIHGNARGFPGGARLVTITGNVIGSQRRGVELRHVTRVTVTGNTLYDSAELSLLASHCEGLTFTANTLGGGGTWSDPPRDGVRLEDCSGGVVSGVTAERLGAGTPDRGAAITLLRCRDVAVTDCQVLDAEVRGIELDDCVRCRVAGNTVVDRRPRRTMREAVRARGGRDNLVAQNLVGGATGRAIEVEAGSAAVKDNTEAG
jgi:hypothetical protein